MPLSEHYRVRVRQVSVVVSDPWSFVEQLGSNTFAATVREVDGDLLLVKMVGILYVARPRNGDNYSLTPTTAEQCGQGAPWGEGNWRGQPPALLADIRGG